MQPGASGPVTALFSLEATVLVTEFPQPFRTLYPAGEQSHLPRGDQDIMASSHWFFLSLIIPLGPQSRFLEFYSPSYNSTNS